MPSHTHSFMIHKRDDRDLLSCLKDISEEFDQDFNSVSFVPRGVSQSQSLGNDFGVPSNSVIDGILSKGSLIIKSINLVWGRGAYTLSVSRSKEPGIDNASVTCSNAGKTNEYLRLLQIAESKLGRYDAILKQTGAVPKAVRDAIAAREAAVDAQVQALATLTEKFSSQIVENQARAEDIMNRRQDELDKRAEEEHERLRSKYEKQKADLEAVRATEEQALRLREKALQERSAELDAMDAQHARRSLRKDLKEELKSRASEFALTSGTQGLREPITYFSIILLVIFGAGFVGFSIVAGFLAFKESASVAEIALAAARSAIFGIGFGLTSVYYIRWQQSWFDKHATEEFQQKRFDLDLDRASWLVETALDWRTQTEHPMPEMMLERLSDGLFSTEGVAEEALHPSDQLASALLGASAEAELQIPGGSSLRLDRKGISQLRKGGS